MPRVRWYSACKRRIKQEYMQEDTRRQTNRNLRKERTCGSLRSGRADNRQSYCDRKAGRGSPAGFQQKHTPVLADNQSHWMNSGKSWNISRNTSLPTSLLSTTIPFAAKWPTVCPTCGKFAASHDLIFFVSGKKSSNGKMLFKECKKVNPNSHLIDSADEIDRLFTTRCQFYRCMRGYFHSQMADGRNL